MLGLKTCKTLSYFIINSYPFVNFVLITFKNNEQTELEIKNIFVYIQFFKEKVNVKALTFDYFFVNKKDKVLRSILNALVF